MSMRNRPQVGPLLGSDKASRLTYEITQIQKRKEVRRLPAGPGCPCKFCLLSQTRA